MTTQNNPNKIKRRLRIKPIKRILSSSNQKAILSNAKASMILRIKKINPRINRNNTIISFLLLIIIAIITICYLQSVNSTVKIIENTRTINKAGVLSKGTPSYKTLLPAGKSISQLGGWTRVSPSNVDPVYAFVDKIGEIPINLSQQPLPKEFETNTNEQIATLASDFRAENKLTIGSTTVYIGTSGKGPQSVIFAKNNLLILIKSSVQISNEKWTDYINSLQ